MRERTGKKKSRLETWLKSAATPVFLVSASRRVLFFNAGCQQLTGWTAPHCNAAAQPLTHTSSESVLGVGLDYQVEIAKH